jgi:hypothetical protein
MKISSKVALHLQGEEKHAEGFFVKHFESIQGWLTHKDTGLTIW